MQSSQGRQTASSRHPLNAWSITPLSSDAVNAVGIGRRQVLEHGVSHMTWLSTTPGTAVNRAPVEGQEYVSVLYNNDSWRTFPHRFQSDNCNRRSVMTSSVHPAELVIVTYRVNSLFEPTALIHVAVRSIMKSICLPYTCDVQSTVTQVQCSCLLLFCSSSLDEAQRMFESEYRCHTWKIILYFYFVCGILKYSDGVMLLKTHDSHADNLIVKLSKSPQFISCDRVLLTFSYELITLLMLLSTLSTMMTLALAAPTTHEDGNGKIDNLRTTVWIRWHPAIGLALSSISDTSDVILQLSSSWRRI